MLKKISENTLQLKKWTGEFGRSYTQRNTIPLIKLDKIYQKNFGITRTALNRMFLGNIKHSDRILEIGSNTGNQLLFLQKMGFTNLYGIEPQKVAVEAAKSRTRGINIIKGDVFGIPFKDGYFDLVFTSGVLIHIHPKDIKKSIKEIYRCSRKYIWGYEYYNENYKEVVYRGHKKLLWKADFPGIYVKLFPDLKIVKIKYLKYLENNNVDVMFLLKKKNAK